MITIPNTVLRLVRTLAKQLVGVRKRRTGLKLHVHPGNDGVALVVRYQDFVLRHDLPADRNDSSASAEPFVVPFDELQDVLKSPSCDVDFVRHADALVVYWTDRGVERSVCVPFTTPASSQPVPQLPAEWTEPGPEFADAYVAAAATTCRDSVRFALTHVQFDGRQGRLAATNGVEGFLAGGFEIPWDETVLVPATAPLGHRGLSDEPLRVARVIVPSDVSDAPSPKSDHVIMGVGPTTFWLPVAGGRFPDMDRVIPTEPPPTRLALDRDDARTLVQALDAFPGNESTRITVELDDHVVVTSSVDGEVVDVSLPGSRTLGRPTSITMRRRCLTRAAGIGGDEIAFYGDARPAVCRAGQQTYVWMPLVNPSVQAEVDTSAVAVTV